MLRLAKYSIRQRRFYQLRGSSARVISPEEDDDRVQSLSLSLPSLSIPTPPCSMDFEGPQRRRRRRVAQSVYCRQLLYERALRDVFPLMFFDGRNRSSFSRL